jgi:hypothetical protein
MTIQHKFDEITKLSGVLVFNFEQYESALWEFSLKCRAVMHANPAAYNRKALETFPFWPDPNVVGIQNCCAWWLGSWEMWERIFPDQQKKLFQENL